jgi:hypothetical protein
MQSLLSPDSEQWRRAFVQQGWTMEGPTADYPDP